MNRKKLEKLAKQGNVEAQYELGVLLEKLSKVIVNYESEAKKWLTMAAEAGHVEARRKLGI